MKMKKNLISVCMGPGCKAWDSEFVSRKLKKLFFVDKAISVNCSECLDNCGGGVSIKFSKNNEVIKIKSLDIFEDSIIKILNNGGTAHVDAK